VLPEEDYRGFIAALNSTAAFCPCNGGSFQLQ
jgi:hypothetical protein